MIFIEVHLDTQYFLLFFLERAQINQIKDKQKEIHLYRFKKV